MRAHLPVLPIRRPVDGRDGRSRFSFWQGTHPPDDRGARSVARLRCLQMRRVRGLRRKAVIAVAIVADLLVLTVAVSPPASAADTTPPTTPKNLRVTAASPSEVISRGTRLPTTSGSRPTSCSATVNVSPASRRRRRPTTTRPSTRTPPMPTECERATPPATGRR